MEKKFGQSFFKTKARNAYLADPAKIENPPISHSYSKYNDSYWVGRSGNGANSNGRTPYETKGRAGGVRPRDEAEGGGPVTLGSGETMPKREYIDYDDPMSGQGGVGLGKPGVGGTGGSKQAQ